MNYSFPLAYNISDDDFEKLVSRVCDKFFGNGLVVFSKGKDGGKDGRFTGKALNFKGWDGKIIVQAKHCNEPFASCSDNDFFANKTSIINKEIERLKKIRDSEGLDYYVLFTNRKLSGVTDGKIRKHISDCIKIPIENVELFGIENFNHWLGTPELKSLVKEFSLSTINFDFSEKDIKEIIIEFKKQLPSIEKDIKKRVEEVKYNYDKISDVQKNKKNELSQKYYEQVIEESSLRYFTKIELFLENPINETLKDYYFDVTVELKDLILIKRDEFGNFEEIFEFIYQKIALDEILRGKKRFIKVLLHYMYHTCSIGIK